MRTFSSIRILTVALLALSVLTLRADREEDLLAALQSAADVPAKCSACQQLRAVGTAKSVPVLAGLLGEERVSQAARYALEGMPCAEAGAALRTALGKTAGPFKAGIIDSLGWRRDTAAVPMISPLLADSDPVIASASATALSRIGGKEALIALNSARNTAVASVRPAVLEALLRCADALVAAGDTKGADKVYASLADAKSPEPVRLAAWRGRVMAEPAQRAKLVMEALTGHDKPVRLVALKVVRELNDPKLIKEGVRQWAALPAEAQVAFLDAQVRLGKDPLPVIRLATQSPSVPVRAAGWQALAEVNDVSLISALAKAAAEGQPAERDAARDTLTRLHGSRVGPALLKQAEAAEPPAKAALLRALGERREPGAAPVLLRYAAAPEPARSAALDGLRNLAAPETLKPLLDLAAASKTDADSEAVLNAAYPICQASADKTRTTAEVLTAFQVYTPSQRSRVLPVLAELGTPAALEAAVADTRSADPEAVKQAVRVLSQWPNAAAAPRLLDLAKSSSDNAVRALALRGCADGAGHETDLAQRLALLRETLGVARQPAEKSPVFGQLGQIPTPEALSTALGSLGDPEVANEAALAAISIAEKLAPTNPKLAEATAARLLAQSPAQPVAQRAMALTANKAGAGPFIQDWLVCGPYEKAGVAGAEALFHIPFGPEVPGQPVRWMKLPRGKNANLGGAFPNRTSCVAYLKTVVVAPSAADGTLLMGSDDGVKAWLNGAVVHSNNVDRGMIADQDRAPIHLKPGANELMLKITQGGGGWAACARIVGADGQPIPGLRVERQNGAALTASDPAPAAAAPATPPVPSKLPPRDNYRKLKLSDQFYAEGAYYADFNKDGKLDVVAGPFWFEGPDFQKRHEYRPVKTFEAAKEYSDNFLTYAGDCNGDGWPDVICIPFPGKEGYWYENPAGKEGHWKQHLFYNNVGNESPVWGDLLGNGKPVLLFCNDGYLGYAGPDWAHADQPWVFHAVSGKDKRYQKFTHGVGFGDINGDKRNDVVEAAGWWEQPAELKDGQPWIWHPFHFSDAAAQMYVYDVDGDGLADVITAWHCHRYGLVWWQQLRGSDGKIDFRRHVILPPEPDLKSADFRVSQLHAMELADFNGDGIKDILTGKRFWSHGPTGDVEPDAPAVVFWLELRRGGPEGVTFVPHLIDDDSGVGTQVAAADLNGDGRPDVIVANKKGIFIHLSQPKK